MSVLASGCSTMDSIGNADNYPRYQRKVYAGTRNDLCGIPYLFTDEPAWGMLALGELPFCLVADTILLPYAIYLDCHNDEGKNQPNQENATK